MRCGILLHRGHRTVVEYQGLMALQIQPGFAIFFYIKKQGAMQHNKLFNRYMNEFNGRLWNSYIEFWNVPSLNGKLQPGQI